MNSRRKNGTPTPASWDGQSSAFGHSAHLAVMSIPWIDPKAKCHHGHLGKAPFPYPYPDGVRSMGSSEPTDMFKTDNYPGKGKLTSWGNYVAATGDDMGKINLFRWPAFDFKQAARTYIGHGSHVMQTHFSHDDDYLISAGWNDRSLFQCRR